MAYQSRPGKRIHAIRRRSDGSAFQKWEEIMKSCKGGNKVELNKKGYETREVMPLKVVSNGGQ
ncbi:hypothetical protein CDL12_08868 [Handroanthus impetiginosus]|uniref:Uncharacterized protein n=1 Tax=Handroanthus impetiginosus TaxID=429701 RepID=A0A2G9HLQ0_9LAMI|nr:hypothetical protein CDL12_08868 [Handroanthus impetiginosus]